MFFLLLCTGIVARQPVGRQFSQFMGNVSYDEVFFTQFVMFMVLLLKSNEAHKP